MVNLSVIKNGIYLCEAKRNTLMTELHMFILAVRQVWVSRKFLSCPECAAKAASPLQCGLKAAHFFSIYLFGIKLSPIFLHSDSVCSGSRPLCNTVIFAVTIDILCILWMINIWTYNVLELYCTICGSKNIYCHCQW